MQADFKFEPLFWTTAISAVIIAAGALGLKKYNEDNQKGSGRNFMIFTIILGVLGVVFSIGIELSKGGKKHRL